MPKDFDNTLSDAIDLAAGAARTAGATAARIRGRKRTVRKQIAVSTLSFVLVAVGATVAFKASASHDGGTPQMTAASPHGTASPSRTAVPTQSPTATPTTTGTASETASPTHSAPASPPSSNPATTTDPHQVVDAAWLTPELMPFAGTFTWKAMRADPQGSSPIGQQLTPTVFYIANDTSLQTLTMCADPTKLLGRTTGAQHTDYTATTGTGNNQASQYIFFFADATAAQQTFAWLQSQYGPSCLSGGGATVTKTAGNGTTSATWLTVGSASAAPDLPTYSREFFVLRGSTIALASVTSYTNKLPTAYPDAAQLSTIAAHLCVYGGPCR